MCPSRLPCAPGHEAARDEARRPAWQPTLLRMRLAASEGSGTLDGTRRIGVRRTGSMGDCGGQTDDGQTRYNRNATASQSAWRR